MRSPLRSSIGCSLRAVCLLAFVAASASAACIEDYSATAPDSLQTRIVRGFTQDSSRLSEEVYRVAAPGLMIYFGGANTDAAEGSEGLGWVDLPAGTIEAGGVIQLQLYRHGRADWVAVELRRGGPEGELLDAIRYPRRKLPHEWLQIRMPVWERSADADTLVFRVGRETGSDSVRIVVDDIHAIGPVPSQELPELHVADDGGPQPAVEPLTQLPAMAQRVQPALLAETETALLMAVSPTEKVLPGEAPDDPDSRWARAERAGRLEIAAAAGETEQVLLVLRPGEVLEGVRLRGSKLRGRGKAIPEAAWSWRRAETVHVERPSEWYGIRSKQTGEIPDPLLPGEPFDAPAGENTLLLLQIQLPADAPAGLYGGEIVLETDSGWRRTIPVAAEVWPLRMPAERSIETHCHEMERSGYGWRLSRAMNLTYLKYGAGGIDYNFDRERGVFDLEFDEYRRQLEIVLDDLGFEKVALPPSLLGKGRGLADSYISTGLPVGEEAFWPVYRQYMTKMRNFYAENGWNGRVFFRICDEIHHSLYPKVARLAEVAHECFPELEIILTTNRMPEILAEHVDTWVVPWHFFVTRAEDIGEWDRLRRSGVRMWAYMNSIYTLNAADALTDMRLYPSVLAKYGFEGNLWWSLSKSRGKDPWVNAVATMNNRRTGEVHYANGYCLYPPRPQDPYFHSSLRYESYLQGLDDADLMNLYRDRWQAVLESLGGHDAPAFSADQAMRWWGSMLSGGFRIQTYRNDGSYIERFRQILAHELSLLEAAPLALIDCEIDEASAMRADTLHIRGFVQAGTRIRVNGEDRNGYLDEDAPFVFVANVPLEIGRNCIAVELTAPTGESKTFYREVYRIDP